MNVFGKFEELLRIIFRTSSGNHTVSVEPSSSTAGDRAFTLPEPGQTADELTSNVSTQTLENKSLVADSTEIVDETDPTKRASLDAAAIPTATDVTLTLPNQTTTLVGTNTTDDLDNKTLNSPVVDGTITGTAIDTDLSDGATANTVPSSAAVKTYADTVSGDVQSNLDDHINDATDAHDSTAITNTPAGNITATTTQAAVNELDSEKLARDGSQAMTGDLNMDTNQVTDVGGIELEDGATVDTETTSGIIDIGGTNAQQVQIGRAGQTTTIRGDLQVDGTTTTVNSATLEVADPNITINEGGNDASSEGAGLTVERTSTDGSLIYRDTSASKFAAGPAGSEVDLVNTTGSQTLSGKSIDADANTITNIEDADIKSGAAIDATKIADGSVDNTEYQRLGTAGTDAAGELVTTDGTQDLDNKQLNNPTIDGTSISDTSTPVSIDASTSGLTLDGDVSGTMVLDEDDLVSDSDTKLATQQSIKAYVDASVGSSTGSGSGEINYVTNGLFAANADDWRAYDLFGSPLVVGAALTNTRTASTGTPAVGTTITRSTAYVIEGTASGLMTKAAGADYSGEGIATDFSMPRGQTQAAQKVTLRYRSTSTDFTGNLEVYIIKNTSGSPQLEQLTDINITAVGPTNQQIYEAVFLPTADVEDYRLLIHNNSTDTNLSEFYFDSVVIGPENVEPYPDGRFTNLVRDGRRNVTDGNWSYVDNGLSAPAAYSDVTPSGFPSDFSMRPAAQNYPNTDFDSTGDLRVSWSGTATGQGLSTPINVPNSYENRLMTLEFDYEVLAQGTRDDTSLQVFFVSDTDEVVQPADPALTISASGIVNYRSTVVLPDAIPEWRLVIQDTSAINTSTTLALGMVYLGVGAPGNIAQVPLATSDAPGIVQKNKWARHDQTGGNFDTTGEIPGLRFTNLVSGQLYRYTVNCDLSELTTTASSKFWVAQVVGAPGVATREVRYRNVCTGNQNQNITLHESFIFESDGSDVYLNVTTATQMRSRGTTYAQLEELHNYEPETTDFD